MLTCTEIERVKRANELVSFIRGGGVVLTQRGKQLAGLCPFHDDHEPSLVVDPKKQLWNCLGACHEGGDVYRFVMKADGVDFREAHRRLGDHKAEAKSVGIEDQQWLERAVEHYHARLLETSAAQDYVRSRGITAAEFVTSFRVGYEDGTLAAKLPAEGRRALRRIGVLTGSGRELLRGCVLFPLVAAGGANSGHAVGLYGRSIEGRRHLYLPGERRGVFNPQGAKNTDEVIITESVIDAAALWSAGLRNVIPVYGVTGLTEEIMAHLVECRVKRVVLLLEADDAGRAASALANTSNKNIEWVFAGNPAFERESANWNHIEGRTTFKQKGDDIILHAVLLDKPADDYTAFHFDSGGGTIMNSEHRSDWWNKTGPSPDRVSTGLGQTSAGQYLKGISPSLDKLLTQKK